MIEIYSDKCFDCRYRTLSNNIKAFGRANVLRIEIRRTDISGSDRQMSQVLSNEELPFIYNHANKKCLHLTKLTTMEDLATLL